jgi:osmotically inducible protein OsmC
LAIAAATRQTSLVGLSAYRELEIAMSHLYETKVTATGGRHGTIRSDDGLLLLSLAMPESLGGPGGATNPEQLFAGGYAACFENALLRIAREAGVTLADPDVEVTAEIGLDRNAANAFVLSAALTVTIAGIAPDRAQELVHRADAICPYSNAIRGNVAVAISVSVR